MKGLEKGGEDWPWLALSSVRHLQSIEIFYSIIFLNKRS